MLYYLTFTFSSSTHVNRMWYIRFEPGITEVPQYGSNGLLPLVVPIQRNESALVWQYQLFTTARNETPQWESVPMRSIPINDICHQSVLPPIFLADDVSMVLSCSPQPIARSNMIVLHHTGTTTGTTPMVPVSKPTLVQLDRETAINTRLVELVIGLAIDCTQSNKDFGTHRVVDDETAYSKSIHRLLQLFESVKHDRFWMMLFGHHDFSTERVEMIRRKTQDRDGGWLWFKRTYRELLATFVSDRQFMTRGGAKAGLRLMYGPTLYHLPMKAFLEEARKTPTNPSVALQHFVCVLLTDGNCTNVRELRTFLQTSFPAGVENGRLYSLIVGVVTSQNKSEAFNETREVLAAFADRVFYCFVLAEGVDACSRQMIAFLTKRVTSTGVEGKQIAKSRQLIF